MTNRHRGTLYIGVTNDVIARTSQHKQDLVDGFTKKYKLHKLVYYEVHDNPYDAIQREKQLKEWHRSWKIELIERDNPDWRDLSDDF